jgi:hypothetical protein
MSLEELGAALAEVGATRSRDPAGAASQAIRHSDRFQELPDGRWFDRLGVLGTTPLLHRLTDVERQLGALRVDPDLSLAGPLIGREPWRRYYADAAFRLVWLRDGRLRADREPVPDRFVAPDGEDIGGRTEGALMAVVVDPDSLQLRLVDPPDPPIEPIRQAAIESIAGMATRQLTASPNDSTPPVSEIAHLLFEALALDPTVLRSAAVPVGDLLREAGLVTYRELCGWPGTDWREHEYRTAVGRILEWRWWMHEVEEDFEPAALAELDRAPVVA